MAPTKPLMFAAAAETITKYCFKLARRNAGDYIENSQSKGRVEHLNHEHNSDPGEPSNDQWLHRTNGVDLLEIYHARQLRAQIIEQLRRLAEQAGQPERPGLCAGELGVFYEGLLMNVEHLLSALGDGSTNECWT